MSRAGYNEAGPGGVSENTMQTTLSRVRMSDGNRGRPSDAQANPSAARVHTDSISFQLNTKNSGLEELQEGNTVWVLI